MPSYPLPDGPHNDDWKQLLPWAFSVVEEVERRHGVSFPIRIGGGSMLLRRYRHRKSRDLDLFVADARLARWCSPRHNEAAGNLFPDYGEDATSVKLIVGLREVDIIVAAPLIDNEAVDRIEMHDRTVEIERPREILAKKVAYRGRNFQPRDVFDLACIANLEPDEVAAVLPILNLTHVDDLEARLREIEPILARELGDKIEPFPDFAPMIGSCLDIASKVARTWRDCLTPGVEVPPYPRRTHRASYSRDGRTVVIRQWDPERQRYDKIGNTLGPAKVGPKGKRFLIDGLELPEAEWRRHPAVVAAASRQLVAEPERRPAETPPRPGQVSDRS
jgi:hypothetical protein